MSTCPTCKESIISQTASLIGQTNCNSDCPEDITCEDIIPSNCVFYSGVQLICPSGSTSVNYGDTLTVALGKMYDLICQNSTSNTVQVTGNDTCYGYLASKVTSTSLAITVSNPGACEKLNIEQKCLTWTPIGINSTTGVNNFRNKWKNTTGASNQIAQYSTEIGCKVTLRGQVTNTVSFQPGLRSSVIAVLSTLPVKDRKFSVTVQHSNSALILSSGYITIDSFNGNVTLTYVAAPVSGNTDILVVSLDGITYETN